MLQVQDDPVLQLDVEGVERAAAKGRARGAETPLLRIYVAFALGYTAGGAAPTITADCRDVTQLEGEVERLKQQLDRAVVRAREVLGEAPSEAPAPPAAATVTPAKPHLDPGLRVADLMTPEVRTVGRNDRLSVADELMRLGRLRHAVVLDEEGTLAGVLSQRDIFYGALAWSLGQGREAHRKALESILVKDVMHADVVTIAPDAPLSQAAAVMSERKIGCLPVMEGPRLVGILTEGDFLALLSRSDA